VDNKRIESQDALGEKHGGYERHATVLSSEKSVYTPWRDPIIAPIALFHDGSAVSHLVELLLP